MSTMGSEKLLCNNRILVIALTQKSVNVKTKEHSHKGRAINPRTANQAGPHCIGPVVVVVVVVVHLPTPGTT